ncbi:sensor histidine kinase [Sunxiuqinia sp. A32]|uniref:sensor histidine kinase n=1 Tax=Sunxiuqinia sp. A32 TaxID=3461496 RepID=UPI0040464601
MVEAVTDICDREDCRARKSMNEDSSKQIISSISHELRTPLSIISSNLQLLKSTNGQIDDEIRSETFMLCDEAIKSMSRFLDDIYFLNVSIKGELKRIPEEFNIKKYFKKLLKEFSFLDFENDRLLLTMDLASKKMIVDKELLSRSMHNVISNALKFSPDKVIIDVKFDGKLLMVTVEDKGIGIPEDEIDLIFTPFFRANNVKMISGTGLGMSITKKSLDCLGGEINIESEVSKGTIVKLIIPNDEW